MSSTDSTVVNTSLGNVNSREVDLDKISKSKKSKKKTLKLDPLDLAKRGWFISLNQGQQQCTPQHLIEAFTRLRARKFAFQLESGHDTGQPHYQGFVMFANVVKFRVLLNIFNGFWQPLTNPKSAEKYVMKEDTRIDGPWTFGIPKPIFIFTNLYPWQNQIKTECMAEPGRRIVNWIYDPVGSAGKTEFVRHMIVKTDACFVGAGKAAYIICAINERQLNNKPLDVILVNYSRSHETAVSYDAIEQIKDGLMFNTKYVSGAVVFNPPHVYCFANFLPESQALSLDRWKIRLIDGGQLFPMKINEFGGWDALCE